MTGIEQITTERQHQIDNGWTEKHDRDEGPGHIAGEIYNRFNGPKAGVQVLTFLYALTDEQWAELGAFAAAELDRREAPR